MLALLVLICVVVAPLRAPDYRVAEDLRDRIVDSPAFSSDDSGEDIWDGYRFPGDDLLHASFFSLSRSTASLPDPEEYVPRAGIGFPRGGGEPTDYSFLDVDGSRVFPLAKGSFRVSQEFGCVPYDPGYAQTAFCPPDRPSFHHGVDFATKEGAPIYASATGTVNSAGIDRANDAGNSVIRIIHDGDNSGYVTEYFHWRTSFVEPGDYVIAGQPIGEVASIGYSTGPHLHFGVFDSGVAEYVDPLAWLKGSESLHVAAGAGGVGGSDAVMQWASLIQQASGRYGIPAGLIAAIITVESSGNPEAVSPVGAQGLMQVMPMHLERYGIPASKWRDPATNIDAGTRLLAELVTRHGTLTNAVGAYFGFGCDVLGTCTEDYIAAVFTWFSHYVPIFGDVDFDADEFEPPPPPATDLGTPDTNRTPEATATPEPTVTPEPSPSPSPSPSPTADPDSGDQQRDDSDSSDPAVSTPSPQPTPEPTPIDDSQDSDGELPASPDTKVVDAFDSRWQMDTDAGVVLRLDPAENVLIAMIEVGSEPWAIAASEDRIWVVSRDGQTLARIDPESNEVDEIHDLESKPVGIAIIEQVLWIAFEDPAELIRYQIDDLTPLETIELPGEPCQLWPDAEDDQLVIRICDQDDLHELDLDELSG